MTTKLDKEVSAMVKEINKKDTCFFCKRVTRVSDVLNMTATQIMCPDNKLHICHNSHYGVK